MKWLFANELITFKKLTSVKTERNFVKFFGYMYENRPDFGSILIKKYNYGTLYDFSRNVILITYNYIVSEWLNFYRLEKVTHFGSLKN